MIVSSALIREHAETVVVHIAPRRPGIKDTADGVLRRPPVQRGDMIQIDGFDLLLRGEFHNKIPRFKGGLRGDLEAEVRGIGGGAGRMKGAAVLAQQKNHVIHLIGGNIVIPNADGQAENGHCPHQRRHGD